ncbi:MULTISPECIES: hypothetical protein [unclassified Nocardioides]|uniref:hypothetical protein n=1 Tax=unclassified Nocardioides TaxID=2615069 RepID=UPI00301534E5
MGSDVFLSVGRTSSVEQEAVIKALEQALRTTGVAPRTVGRTDFSSAAPLKQIEKVLDECHGTVVLALERMSVEKAVARRGSPDESAISQIRLPTVWNHIEAAMSYRQGLPLLMIVERGLLPEGLLEPSYDWYVQTIAPDPAAFQTNEFRAVLADWVKKVEAHAAGASVIDTPVQDVTALPLGVLLKSMTVPQIWAALGSIGALLVTVALVAYKLGAA